MTTRMPLAAAHLARFGGVLRRNGFLAAADQTIAFLAGVVMLGPGGIDDVHQAALACYGPAPERRGEFDTLFRACFYGDAVAVASAEAEEQALGEAATAPSGPQDDERSGEAASMAELLKERAFSTQAADAALRRLAAQAKDRLPRRKAFRQTVTAHGRAVHLRASLRHLLRNDGDIPRPVMAARALKQRNVLILIDVSGSMKGMTDGYLRLCHTVAQAANNVEAFTFATRLSRITPALKLRGPEAALAAASARVADWDGGTRIGPCLLGFLDVPRYACFARGASVLVISDGMERGDPSDFVRAVWRLSRLAHRLTWATPLLSDPRYEPRTRAMRAILPALNDLVDGSTTARLADAILDWSVPGRPPAEIWTADGTRKTSNRQN